MALYCLCPIPVFEILQVGCYQRISEMALCPKPSCTFIFDGGGLILQRMIPFLIRTVFQGLLALNLSKF